MSSICFIGAGKMATAIASGLLKKDFMMEIHAFDPSKSAAETFHAACEGEVHENQESAMKNAEIVVLAVKPQFLLAAAAGIKPFLGNKLVVSIVAGVKISILESLLGTKRIVRVMPNTPALVGEGMSCIAATTNVTAEDVASVESIFLSVGHVRKVRESLMDAVTGLSGSGPAFVLEFIMALADGGVYAGLPRDTALELAVQTVIGGAKLAQQDNRHPAELRDAVVSPAGTTSRGCMMLAEGNFASTVASAVIAAANRSSELGSTSK